MPGVAPSPAVVAAASVPAFVLADIDLAEMLAPLAPFTTPERFQLVLFDLVSSPEALDALKRKHARLSELCPRWCSGMESPGPRPYDGPERRRWCRDSPAAPNLIGRARVQTKHRRLYPSIPDWVAIMDRNPAALEPMALPGYVWIGAHGRLIPVRADHFDFREDPR